MVLLDDIARLESELGGKQALLQFMEGRELGNTAGFSEHLADLRCRYEVAICTKRISAAIICGVCHAHIFGNANGTRRFNAVCETLACGVRVRRHCYAACEPLP